MPLMFQVFLNGQFAIQTGGLKRHSQHLSDGRLIGCQIKPGDLGGPLLQRQQGRENAEQRGFATAVGAQQAEDLTA